MAMYKKYIYRFGLELHYQADFNFVNAIGELGNKWYNRTDPGMFGNASISGLGIQFLSMDESRIFETDWKKTSIKIVCLGEADFSRSLFEVFPDFRKVMAFLENTLSIIRSDLEKPFKHFLIRYELFKEMQTSQINLSKILAQNLLSTGILVHYDGKCIEPTLGLGVYDGNNFELLFLDIVTKQEYKKLLDKPKPDFGTECQIRLEYKEGINKPNEDYDQPDKHFMITLEEIEARLENSYIRLGDYYSNLVNPIKL